MITSSQFEIDRLLDHEGAIAVAKHPELARATTWLAECGQLSRALPGVYVRSTDAADRATRIRALLQWDANAVLTHQAAASWSFWPDIRGQVVTAALPTKRRAPVGYSFERRIIPAELVRFHSGAYLTSPALTALDLGSELGGDGIDRALRVGATTLEELHRAMDLSPHRRGNRQRFELLRDSRDVPWASSERLLHRLLRAAGVTGWRSNVPVTLAEGCFSLDVAFALARVAVEIDGWEFHARRPPDFDATMRKHSALVAAGWRVLHFTWTQLVDEPEWVLRTILATLERENRHLTTFVDQGRRSA